MTDYLVEWIIDIDAGNPREAAQVALSIQRDPGSTATIFELTDKITGKKTVIDLEEGEESE